MVMKYLVKEALSTKKSCPPLETGSCINSRQSKLTCEACVRACPAGVIVKPEQGKVDWERCIGCGVCGAVCPSGAFGFVPSMDEKGARALSCGKQRVILGCTLASGEADQKAWCLSAYRWEMIAALALTGRVEIIRGDCEGCERAKTLACFEETLQRVCDYLGEARFDQQVTLHDAGEAAPRGVTRRELFTGVFSGMREAGQNMQEIRTLGRDAQDLRLQLIRRAEKTEKSEAALGWVQPDFTDACWGCGICEKICPNKAIEMESKNGVFRVVCYPVLCSGCGACAAVCPEKAIAGVKEIRLAQSVKRVQKTVAADVCTECGAAVKPGSGQTMCLRCRVKPKKKK